MKNTLLPLALAAAGLFAIPAISHAQATDGAFINGNIGRASVNNNPFNDSDTGYGINAGYRWAVSPSALIGIEGGYVDLGKYSGTVTGIYFPPGGGPPSAAGSTGNARAEVSGWTIGANGHFNLSPNWYISARAGFFRADLSSRFQSTDTGDTITSYRYSDNANSWYAGAGFGYDFSNNFSLGLNYDYYHADKNGLNLSPDIFSVSGEYRF